MFIEIFYSPVYENTVISFGGNLGERTALRGLVNNFIFETYLRYLLFRLLHDVVLLNVLHKLNNNYYIYLL